MKLSKREIFLLFILSLLGSSGLIYGVIIQPIDKTLTAQKQDIQELESQKLIIDTYTPQLEALSTQLSQRVEEVSIKMKKIEAPFNEAEFDLKVLPRMNALKMKVLEAVFVEPHVVGPVEIDSAYQAPIYEIKILVDEFNDIQGQVILNLPDPTLTVPSMLQSDFSYQVTTEYENYLHLLDEVRAWGKSIYVTQSSYNFETRLAEYAFDVYSIEQLKAQ